MHPAAHPTVHDWLQRTTAEIQQALQEDPWQAIAPFVALYERFAQPLAALARDRYPAPTQADFAEVKAWQHIWQTLQQTETTWELAQYQAVAEAYWSELWLPPTEAIAYDRDSMPLPLWIYTQAAIAQLPGIDRLLLVLTYTYRWSLPQVVEQLQLLGHRLAEPQVRSLLDIAEVRLLAALPPDWLTIYGDRSFASLPALTRSPF